MGNRFFTFSTVVRVNQIETSSDESYGTDESSVHGPEEARTFREAIEKGWPGARITWSFSWLALKDQRPNYLELKKLVVSYHEKYGDEITFIPGVITWDLCSQMTSKDVMSSVDKALRFTGIKKENAPKILTDNAKCYLSAEILAFFGEKGIKPINGKPMHPQTQGKIERYHRTLKNVIKLDNYYSPEDLIKALTEFVQYYNNERYHESLRNLAPADIYFGRDKKILKERSKTKAKSLQVRRENYIVRKLELDYENF